MPTQTTNDETRTVRSDAPTTSAPWLGGDTRAANLASTRDDSAVLLLHPILTNTQRAAARPNNHHSNLVGRTGCGDAASPKNARARRPKVGCRRLHRGQVRNSTSAKHSTGDTVEHNGGEGARTLDAATSASARTGDSWNKIGSSTA